MLTLLDMVTSRLPDEAALFAASLAGIIEESQALAGYEGILEADMTTLQKSLVADMAAQALVLPAMSTYKKALEEAEGDGAGRAKFADKLKFLQEMDKRLAGSIEGKKAILSTAADTGVPMTVIES